MFLNTAGVSTHPVRETFVSAHDTHQWLHIVPPGVSDPDVQFDGPLTRILSAFIKSACDPPALAGVDILTYPGGYHRSYLLRPLPLAFVDGSMVAKRLSERADLSELVENGVDPAMAGFAKRAERELVNRIGLEVVNIDTTPLGKTPGTTLRFVSPTEAPDVSWDRNQSGSFNEYLSVLQRKQIPHFGRTIIGRTEANTFAVEQQVGLFGQDNHCLYTGDFARILRGSEASDLASNFHLSTLRSNLEVLAETSVRIRLGTPATPTAEKSLHGGVFEYDRRADAAVGDAASMILTSGSEYDRLFGRLTDPSGLREAYETLGVSPTLEIPPRLLPQFLGLVPNYGGTTWKYQAPGRRIPLFTERMVIRSASGTDNISPAVSASTSQSSTSIATTDFAATVIQRLQEYGDTVSNRTHPSVPVESYTRETPSGETEPLIIGTGRTLSKGPLVAAADGVSEHPETGLTVVTDSKEAARSICKLLREPFDDVDRWWTTLYRLPDRHWVNANTVGLLSRGAEYTWQIDPTGKIRLCVDDEVVASGSPTEDITVVSNTPAVFWGLKEPPHYSVFDSDKQLYETAATPLEILKDYQLIQLPAVPSQPSYLSSVSVFYIANNRLVAFDPAAKPAPITYRNTPETVAQFIDTFSCEMSETILSGSTVIAEIREYLHALSSTPLPSESTIRYALWKFKSQLNPSLDLAETNTSVDPNLWNHTWRYPFGESTEYFDHKVTSRGQELADRLADAYPE